MQYQSMRSGRLPRSDKAVGQSNTSLPIQFICRHFAFARKIKKEKKKHDNMHLHCVKVKHAICALECMSFVLQSYHRKLAEVFTNCLFSFSKAQGPINNGKTR
uniref:Uncharacterized protein n=1 Tax=Anguilla anguilla TaxID=7936 RepID=A0A0E9SPU7_ANGAN